MFIYNILMARTRSVRKKISKGRTQGPRKWGVGPLLFIIWSCTLLVTLGVGALVAGYMMLGLPEISSLHSYRPNMVTEVLDSSYKPLAYWYKEKRWPLPMSQIPEQLAHAFLAAEDARFYEHGGIDFMGVIRAVIKNVEAGGIVQGASTITQQVTRSLLLTPERSWIRKLKEAVLAWQIDASLSKDEILCIYLNQIYLGQGAYGVEAAARTYFAKHVYQLNLAECAMLAGLPQAPSRYNPAKHFERARKRQLYVLRRMVEEGYIRPEEAEAARNTHIVIKSEKLDLPPGVGYFLAEVRKEMKVRYGEHRLLTDGLTIVTTLDREWQKQAASSVRQGIDNLLKRHKRDSALKENVECALVSMEADTGAVRALWGGNDFRKSQFDLAIQGRMQPGSCFKPIVYATALKEHVVAPNSIIVDEPLSLPGSDPSKPWQPENFDKKYMGPITIRTALTYSRNVISVKLARLVGTKAIVEQARRMGISVPISQDLSIALGSSAVPPIQLVQAYSTFPNLGKTVRPQFIDAVMDRNDHLLEELEPEYNESLDPVTAFQMVLLLEGVVQDGTGRYAKKLKWPVGGKTGTTDNYKDAWFMGFTPDVVTGVWVGRKDKKSLGRLETGGRVACPIWTSFMKITIENPKKKDFQVPDGVALVPVNKRTGEIVTVEPDKDKNVVWEAFPVDDLPTLEPSTGIFNLPSILEKIGGLFR